MNRQYTLDIDTQLYSSRQNTYRVGAYYNKMVTQRILKTTNPTPLLSPEKTAILENVRKAALSMRKQTLVAEEFNDELNDRVQKATSNIGDAYPMNEDSMVRLPRLIGVLS